MKKIILVVIFSLVSFLFVKTNIYAADLEYTCDYQGTSYYNVALRGEIEIYSNGQEVTYVSHYFNNPSVLLNSKEDILNWDSAKYGIPETDLGYEGEASYLKEKKCPEFMIYVYLDICDGDCERIFVSSGGTTVTKMIGILANLEQWKENSPTVTALKLVASTVATPGSKSTGSLLKPVPGAKGNIDFCGDTGVLKATKIAGYIIYVIKILAPLALILFGSIDFMKAVVESDPSKIKNSGISLAKRTVAGVIIFFIPTIITLLLSLITSFDKDVKTDYERCYKCIKKPYDC